MKILYFFSLLLLAVLSLPAITSNSQANETQPVTVIELFTSQSCSSCPPADKYLNELAQQDNVIALSCHVTYWNRLQWKDTLSQRFCDLRQYSYSGAGSRKGVFTPEMIVNGFYSVNGADKQAVQRAIRRTQTPPAGIEISEDEDGKLVLRLPETGEGKNATLWLISYKAGHREDIQAGENRGRKIDYTNAAQTLRNIGHWDGTAQTRRIADDSDDGTISYAVLAQQFKWGPIIAAGKL